MDWIKSWSTRWLICKHMTSILGLWTNLRFGPSFCLTWTHPVDVLRVLPWLCTSWGMSHSDPKNPAVEYSSQVLLLVQFLSSECDPKGRGRMEYQIGSSPLSWTSNSMIFQEIYSGKLNNKRLISWEKYQKACKRGLNLLLCRYVILV